MKSLKYALALAMAATGSAVSAVPAETAATMQANANARADQAVANVCKSFYERLDKNCTTAQRRDLKRLYTAEIARGAFKNQQERNARVLELQTRSMAILGTTVGEYNGIESEVRRESHDIAGEMCTRYEALHGKTCTTAQRRRMFEVVHAQILRGEPAPAEKAQRMREMQADVAGVFGMTYQQFTNPPDAAKNRLAYAVRVHAEKACAEYKETTGKDCTADQRRRVTAAFEEEGARGEPFTAEELVERMGKLKNTLREIFGMAPLPLPKVESAPVKQRPLI